MRRFASIAALLLATVAVAGPPDAAKALDAARTQAKREGKNVLVVFHASWCGWCKRFDKMLEDPKLKPVYEKSFVVLHLDVLENGDKKDLENPSGLAVMEALGGKDAGLPFFAVVAPNGKKVADSLRVAGNVKTNTGHPAAPEEIAHFVTLLKKSAPKMSAGSIAEIEGYLKADAAHR